MSHRRLTISMSDEVYDELKQIAQEDGVTITELLRRAVALYKFVRSWMKVLK